MGIGALMARVGRKPKAKPVSLPAWALDPPIDPRIVDERGITPEREAHSDGASEWGRGDRDRETIRTMRDAPLERMHLRGVIGQKQYDALIKYRNHWYRGGLSSPLQSIDLNRVFASDMANFSGMAKSEAQAFHRQQYRAAVLHLGVQVAAIVEHVVCHEQNLESLGVKLGWPAKPQAIAAATERLKVSADDLCKFWGI